MNKEAVFALRFVVKDLGKMQKAIEQINGNIKKLQENSQKASGGIDKVNRSFSKATRSALKFAAAYFSVSKIMGSVFSKANETVQLKLMAEGAGVAAESVGKLGNALKQYGGDAKSAGAAYKSLSDIIGGARHGMGISEDISRVNAMFGIGFDYSKVTPEELMTVLAKKMKQLKGKDQWGINQIASAYGLDASMAALLAEKGAGWKSYANTFSSGLMSNEATKKLIDAQTQLSMAYDNFISEIGKPLADAINMITPAVVAIAKHLTKGGYTGEYSEKLGNWLGKKYRKMMGNTAFADAYGYTEEQAKYLYGLETFEEDSGARYRRAKGGGSVVHNKAANYYTAFDKDLKELYSGTDEVKAVKAYWDYLLSRSGKFASGDNKVEATFEIVNKTPNDVVVKKTGSKGTINATATVSSLK